MSVLMGVLAAGFVMPGVGVASATLKAAAAGLQDLPTNLETPPQAERSTLLMSDGTRLATFYDENRVYVPLSEIAPVMQHAQIDIEDNRFYQHGAVDVKGTIRAFLRNSSGGSTQGGSSITQQYVKRVQIETALANGNEQGVQQAQEKSYGRKVQEMRYAIALEKRLSKDQILERYLNIAYYGDGAYGVEAAARHFFNKSAKELNLGEAAMLAGLVQSPDAYNPRLHPEAATQRRNVVLDRMAQLDPTLQDQVNKAKATTFDPSKVNPTRNGCASSTYPFVCEYAVHQLLQSPALGTTVQDRERMLNRGGLTIKLTIDPRVQESAQQAVSDVVSDKDPALGTMVMVKPGTGEIQAMAQSRPSEGNGDGETFYNYNATKAMGGAEGYQAGSTFKIFTLAAAMEKGIPTSQTYPADSPMSFQGTTFQSCNGPFVLREPWTVANSTRSAPSMDLQTATDWSVNTFYVQLIRDAGVCNATRMAQKVGVQLASGGDIVKDFNRTPSFVLGVAEVAPVSMAEAMATFASGGIHCDSIIIGSMTTVDGKPLATPTANCQRTIDADVASSVNNILKGVSANGTGRPAHVDGYDDQAGKTGTTDSNQAVWFVGYTPELAGASMIAIDKTNSFWNSHNKSLKGIRLPDSGTYLTGTGSGDAGRIFKSAMSAGLEGKPATPFGQTKPEFQTGQMVSLPQGVDQMKPDDARKALENAGFTVQQTYLYNAAPYGTFLGVTPKNQAPQSSTVYLNFSAGPSPQGGDQSPSPSPTATKGN
ncbi:transglycosylase domain-containing protein [Raineyella fluvialis]|uniref:Penicillin-binding protein n=1 Tax=Raineyella fluvialis TaxID=2662261 RepID=A0A5Q2FBQ3_9ACTN|nr:transglycosylase domain-containing protein [Raineyella fluvialis]QGF22844.1 penicillin-binding protein [Raineyella fluvialis]